MKKEQIFFLLILLSCLLSSSCKTRFTKSELQLFNSYRKGDLLIFQNPSGKADTFLISNKEIDYTNWNPLFRDGIYRLSVAQVKCHRLHGFNPDKKRKWDLISIYKYNPSKIKYDFDFEGFLNDSEGKLEKKYTDTLIINNKAITNYFIIKHMIPSEGLKPNDIEYLFLSLEFGLVKYIEKDGTEWTRIFN